MHSSILGNRYQERVIMVLSFTYSMQERNVPSVFITTWTGDTHSVWAGSMILMRSMVLIFYFLRSRAFLQARYRSACIVRIIDDSNTT